ncbi:hypothetical protein PQR05_36440 [Paraburkholderia sediminicola]|uniref:hypothetical protein n=1 Tax=Paraburkholderia sediminicola TaxID=458836 RepID=UPI0038B9A37A
MDKNTAEFSSLETQMKENARVHRENMNKAMQLQRMLEDLGARAETDEEARRKLERVGQVLKNAGPMVEKLRKEVESQLKQYPSLPLQVGLAKRE